MVIVLTSCSNEKSVGISDDVFSLIVPLEQTQPISVVEEYEIISKDETNPEAVAMEIYRSIMTADRIELDDAYNLLRDVKSDESWLLSLKGQLEDLKCCQGLFLQPRTGGKQYTADVGFYLMDGTVYCHVDYNNYMGDLADGIVQPTQKTDYLFESFPLGEFGRTQNFEIYFSPSQLHIMWAETCDYILYRGDGLWCYDYDTIVKNDTESSENGLTSATTKEIEAISCAISYLNVIAFSRESLIGQLEYEGYSHSEAVYGADHCGADWHEQAALKAADYLDVMAFSKQGLIDQLEYEGFTYEQAVYGVEQNGY